MEVVFLRLSGSDVYMFPTALYSSSGAIGHTSILPEVIMLNEIAPFDEDKVILHQLSAGIPHHIRKRLGADMFPVILY